jgi:hypothetical protein
MCNPLFSVLCAQLVGVSIAFAFVGVAMLTMFSAHEITVQSELARRRRRQKLPTCEWVIEPDLSYSCFISHVKTEASGEALYVKEYAVSIALKRKPRCSEKVSLCSLCAPPVR